MGNDLKCKDCAYYAKSPFAQARSGDCKNHTNDTKYGCRLVANNSPACALIKTSRRTK